MHPTIDARIAAWFLRKTAVNGVRRVAPVSAAIASDIGSVRDENQDRVAIARGIDLRGKPFVALGLADGIGGMRSGSQCAAMALGSLFAGVLEEARVGTPADAWLARASMRANQAVFHAFDGKGGCTLVAAVVTGAVEVHWLSVGDSRVYLSQGSRLAQLSTDDTIAGQLGKPPEAGLDSSNLLQFIGIGPQLEPHCGTDPCEPGSALLLTSDGIHFVDPEWLATIVRHAPDLGLCARRLVENAKACGGPDNASVALASLGLEPEGIGSIDPSVFELWDPFGDAQFLLAAEPQSAERPERRTSAAAPPAVEPQEPLSDNRAPLAGKEKPALAAKTKSKRGRSSKKTKGGGAKGGGPKQPPEQKADQPELLMEFPKAAA